MTCAWKEFLTVLPIWLRKEVDGSDCEVLQELRLRIDSPPELVLSHQKRWLKRSIVREDLQYIINSASQFSPWAAASTAKGFLTISGGHRIGICGEPVIQGGIIKGMKNITSICIRIARDFPGIAEKVASIKGSVLILGPPGWGKTTLLRDLIRQLETTENICVVDERKELFPEGIPGGKHLDILSGCPKTLGIPMLLRTMGPTCIAVDEITDPEDVSSLMHATNCGIRLLATAHASSTQDMRQRNIYRPLWENQIFDNILTLKSNKNYTWERVTKWVTNGSVQY